MTEQTNLPGDVPAYEFIKRQLKQRIDDGTLPEGARVPSELDYARDLGVSRGQTRQALRELELEGYLERYPGKGSFVAPAASRTRWRAVEGMRMVAMACPIITSYYVRTVIEGFSRRLQEEGVQTAMYFLGVNARTEAEFLTSIRQTGVEGLALWQEIAEDTQRERRLLNGFRETRFPFVLCDRYLEDFEADFVGTDNQAVGYALTRRLQEQGHRHIAFAALNYAITTSKERLAGYKRALAEGGAPFREQHVAAIGMGAAATPEAITRLLASRERPTAIVCTDDRAAVLALRALREQGYRVPEDMALACVDDDLKAGALDAPVLRAQQQGEDIGRQIAETLLARIAEPARPVQRRLIEARIVEHDQTGVEATAGAGKGETHAPGDESHSRTTA